MVSCAPKLAVGPNRAQFQFSDAPLVASRLDDGFDQVRASDHAAQIAQFGGSGCPGRAGKIGAIGTGLRPSVLVPLPALTGLPRGNFGRRHTSRWSARR
jgi:hypothetical protein